MSWENVFSENSSEVYREENRAGKEKKNYTNICYQVGQHYG